MLFIAHYSFDFIAVWNQKLFSMSFFFFFFFEVAGKGSVCPAFKPPTARWQCCNISVLIWFNESPLGRGRTWTSLQRKPDDLIHLDPFQWGTCSLQTSGLRSKCLFSSSQTFYPWLFGRFLDKENTNMYSVTQLWMLMFCLHFSPFGKKKITFVLY